MTTNPQPRWRRWGKEALWLLLMALVISTLLDLWRSPTLPEGAMSAPVTLQDGSSTDLATLSQGQAAAGLLLGQLVRGVPFHHPGRAAALARGGKRADGGTALR